MRSAAGPLLDDGAPHRLQGLVLRGPGAAAGPAGRAAAERAAAAAAGEAALGGSGDAAEALVVRAAGRVRGLARDRLWQG